MRSVQSPGYPCCSSLVSPWRVFDGVGGGGVRKHLQSSQTVITEAEKLGLLHDVLLCLGRSLKNGGAAPI